MTDEKPTVSFGYRDVAEDEKSRLVGRVFTNVARRYDVMNDLMSMGIHRVWKQSMIDWLSPAPGTQLIDVAGGTGDISFRFLARLGTKAGDARATDPACALSPQHDIVERARGEAEREPPSLYRYRSLRVVR